ncbi:hypothetical protein glysoja_037989 [Glycine soja]|uniref:Uncharacterized protein n=1 Tax=Glycine soja TaxID=3848 RepID=A0A0B2SIE8_GLYSO|nr:hypothetical protein glysoja_037989 [Glycine soja]
MLDYEWGNPSTIILAGNEGGTTGKPDQTRRQIFDHNFTMLSNNNILQGVSHQYHHHFNPPQPHQHHAFFDPRAFQSAFTTSFSPPPRSMLSLNSIPPLATPHCGLGFLLMHKPDDNLTMGNGAAGRDWQIIIVAEEKLSRLLKKFTNLSILWTMLQGPYLNLELNLRRRRGRWQYVSPPDYFQQQRPNQNRGSSSSTTSISGSLFFSGEVFWVPLNIVDTSSSKKNSNEQ